MVVLLLDLPHDRSTHLARGCFVLALARSVVVQNTAAAETVGGLAVLVTAFFHVFPQLDHLSAELDLAGRTRLALAGVP